MQAPAALPQHAVDRTVRQALDEDAPWGDLTGQTLIPAGAVTHSVRSLDLGLDILPTP